MKKEMLRYLYTNDKNGFPLYAEPRRQWIEEFIEDFFDSHQPERSKREDNQICTASILNAYNG